MIPATQEKVRSSGVPIAVTTACTRGQSQTYGFVATLGNDTTSVERITRNGDHVTSDAVGRSRNVIHRHWEATLRPYLRKDAMQDASLTH